MEPAIEAVERPAPSDRDAILRGLVAHNDATFGASDIAPLAVLLRGASGEVAGGLWGRTTYGWLYVELLFVPEALRGLGLGGRMIAEAERIARDRGCANAWVDCFGEPNRRFYEARGFTPFGRLDEFPPGAVRTFLKKTLA